MARLVDKCLVGHVQRAPWVLHMWADLTVGFVDSLLIAHCSYVPSTIAYLESANKSRGLESLDG